MNTALLTLSGIVCLFIFGFAQGIKPCFQSESQQWMCQSRNHQQVGSSRHESWLSALHEAGTGHLTFCSASLPNICLPEFSLVRTKPNLGTFSLLDHTLPAGRNCQAFSWREQYRQNAIYSVRDSLGRAVFHRLTMRLEALDDNSAFLTRRTRQLSHSCNEAHSLGHITLSKCSWRPSFSRKACSLTFQHPCK